MVDAFHEGGFNKDDAFHEGGFNEADAFHEGGFNEDDAKGGSEFEEYEEEEEGPGEIILNTSVNQSARCF